MKYVSKKQVEKLVEKVNSSKRLVEEGLMPLKFHDDGWRLVFGKSLEFYDFCSAGRKLLELAEYDLDGQGFYYWIQTDDSPRDVMTLAMRAKNL